MMLTPSLGDKSVLFYVQGEHCFVEKLYHLLLGQPLEQTERVHSITVVSYVPSAQYCQQSTVAYSVMAYSVMPCSV